MSSFSCQHYNVHDETCRRVNADCVPGRPGCVLQHNSKFAIPIEERLHRKALEKEGRPPDLNT